MSVALYRKYRPATFGEVRGQEHVTEPLRQALRNERINHAYLFSGPRGCGKTSSARILARSLNCESGPTPDPCGTCDSCTALAPDGGGSIDVIEIDAASHGGVDDARDLRERAFFAPVSSRYKVYIIDEAHMVTREGFNALLKLVEEPPPHLKFVFATTEPDKVIGTIRSRTHHYPFRLIPPSSLRALMEEILTAEGVPFDPAALPLVVRAGSGSARDSLSVLDQLLAGSDEQGITREGAVSLLGFTDSGLLAEMVDALGGRDGAAVFELIDRVVDGGHDPRRFTADLLERVRDLVVLAAVPDALDKGLINVPPEAVEPMREQTGRLGTAELTRAAEILNEGLTQMRGATAPRMLLEILCARVLLPETRSAPPQAASAPAAAPVAAAPPAAHPARPAPAGSARSSGGAAPRPEPAPEPPAAPAAAPGSPWEERPEASPGRPEPAHRPPPAAPAGAGEPDLATVREAWPRVLEAVKNSARVTWVIVSADDVSVAAMEGDNLQLGFQYQGKMRGFLSSGHDKKLEKILEQVFGWKVRVTAVPAGEAAPRAGRASAPSSQPESPPEPVPRSPEPAPAPAAEEPPRRMAAPEEGWPTEPPAEDVGTPDPLLASRRSPGPERAVSRGGPSPPERPRPGGGDSEEAASLSGAALIEKELGGRIIDEIDHGN